MSSARLNVIDLDFSTSLQGDQEGANLYSINQGTLQALFGDDVTACFGMRVQLELTPTCVAGRERPTVEWVGYPHECRA